MRLTSAFIAVLALFLMPVLGAQADGFAGLKLADPPQGTRGALIAEVQGGGPAAAAGFEPGDLVISVDGKPVVDSAQFAAYIREHRRGDLITVDISRRRTQPWRRLTLHLRLGESGSVAGGDAPSSTPAEGGGPPPVQPSSENGPAPVVSQWTQFADPYEHAFVMRVPAGWRVEGGIIRGDIVPAYRITSPDGTMSMSLNDPRLRGLYNVPVGIMGERAMPNTRPYLPAPYFIMQYGSALVGEQCEGPKLRRLRLRPEVAQLIDRRFSVRGGLTIAADALYECERAGRPAMAYIILATHRSPYAGTQYWNIDTLEIAVGPQQRLAGVVRALNETWLSIQYQPSWLRLKGAIMRGQNAAAARALDITLHESQLVDDIIRGVGEYFNPLTGEKVEVPLGYDAYCQSGGTTYGAAAGALRPNCQPLTLIR